MPVARESGGGLLARPAWQLIRQVIQRTTIPLAPPWGYKPSTLPDQISLFGVLTNLDGLGTFRTCNLTAVGARVAHRPAFLSRRCAPCAPAVIALSSSPMWDLAAIFDLFTNASFA